MIKRLAHHRALLTSGVALLALTYSPLALAYIGPGLGSGAVVAVLGTLAGLAMLLVGVIWYPIKRLIRRFKKKG